MGLLRLTCERNACFERWVINQLLAICHQQQHCARVRSDLRFLHLSLYTVALSVLFEQC